MYLFWLRIKFNKSSSENVIEKLIFDSYMIINVYKRNKQIQSVKLPPNTAKVIIV